MVAIKDDGMDWPGFSYSEAEWRRMRELAEPVADGTFRRFIITTAVLFLLIAAAGIVGIFLPLANLLFPVPAETGALHFAVLLAACCLLIIGAGVPLAMSGAYASAPMLACTAVWRRTLMTMPLRRKSDGSSVASRW